MASPPPGLSPICSAGRSKRAVNSASCPTILRSGCVPRMIRVRLPKRVVAQESVAVQKRWASEVYRRSFTISATALAAGELPDIEKRSAVQQLCSFSVLTSASLMPSFAPSL